ncbi:MAG TPA: phosphoenolpyruvate carboxykinase domain-containing protein, partial [Atribacterota bacterium]|nr:phosphoenolpyruvate carboxykinase domain-containing protein [Atribacterota bacterium]
QGVREHDPMAILDFLSIPFADYIERHFSFKDSLKRIPKIFATNYFLKDEKGNFMTPKVYNLLWVLWANGRVNQEYTAIDTPVGLIPKFEDLKEIAKNNLKREYSQEEYIAQFSLRIDKYLVKMDRIKEIFTKTNLPVALIRELEEQIERLKECRTKYNQSFISPFTFYTE